MKKNVSLYLFIMTGLMITSCYYDNEEELYPECNTEGMSHSSDITPIIKNNCYTCHDQASNQGGVTLEGYSNLKVYVDNGKLLGAIKHEPGFSEMPQGLPQLKQCEIDKIEAWIDQGALDN